LVLRWIYCGIDWRKHRLYKRAGNSVGHTRMGRFLSPDWSEDPDAVPYADFTNPQSLNLYGYVDNNPLGYRDPTGHVNEGCTSSGAPDDNGTIVVTINCPQLPPETFDLLQQTPNYTPIPTMESGLKTGPLPAVLPQLKGPEVPQVGPAPINLQQRIAQGRRLFSPHCSSTLASNIPGFTTNGLFHTLTAANAGGRISQFPLSAPLGDDPTANAVTDLGAKTIDLLPYFYTESTTDQAFTLIHEGLHLYTGATDASLQNALHIPISYNTHNITSFIQGGCR
jgi:RHS repeat-associated protein